MELQILDDSFEAIKMVEDYSSLVWTERYASNGEFELQTSQVQSTMADLFPASGEEVVLALRDSTVPMIAEVGKIEKQTGSAPLLTVTGRSFETVLERRSSVKTLPSTGLRPAWTVQAADESDAAFIVIRTVLGDDAQMLGGLTVLPSIPPAVSPNDAIPEIALVLPADYTVATDTFKPYAVDAADLYTTAMNLLTTNNHGLKATRPIDGTTQVTLEIYNGADLTELVVFDARFDQFDDATYLFSQQGSANVAYLYDANGSAEVLKTTVDPTGLDRRVLLIDQTGDTTTANTRTARGLIELYNYNVTALFGGEISVQIAAGYNRDYFLGDIISLTGEYGLSEYARVAEFIRSSDSSGDKSYPTLAAIGS